MLTRRVFAAVLALAAGLALPLSVAGPARADQVRQAQQWVLDALHVPAAWQVTQGSGVTVAVIDSGVNPAAPDLAKSVITGPDLTGTSTPPANAGWGVHGTWMASLIVGHGHGKGGTSGVIGVAPQARVLSIRVITDSADPANAKYQAEPMAEGQRQLAKAVRYAVDYGATVISMSLGYDAPSLEVRSALQYALAHNVVVVASSGNSGTTGTQGNAPYSFPADYLGVLGVGAVGQSGVAAYFSSQNLSVQVAAPGVSVPAQGRDGKYWLVSGTSPACALTAGVVALVRSRYPSLTAAQVRNAITGAAGRRPAGGYDYRVGFGTVNAAAALTAAGKEAGQQPAGQAPTARPLAGGYFGGGAGAVPKEPVAPRGIKPIIAYGGLVAACLLVLIWPVRRLATRGRRRAGDWAGNGPGHGAGGDPSDWQPAAQDWASVPAAARAWAGNYQLAGRQLEGGPSQAYPGTGQPDMSYQSPGFQGPDFQGQSDQGQGYPGQGRPGPDFPGPGMQGPGFQGPGLAGPGLAGPGLQGPGLAGPGLQGPGLQGPGLRGPGFQGPGLQGQGHPGPGDQGPGYQGPADQAPGFRDPGFEGQGFEGPGYQGQGFPPGQGFQGQGFPPGQGFQGQGFPPGPGYPGREYPGQGYHDDPAAGPGIPMAGNPAPGYATPDARAAGYQPPARIIKHPDELPPLEGRIIDRPSAKGLPAEPPAALGYRAEPPEIRRDQSEPLTVHSFSDGPPMAPGYSREPTAFPDERDGWPAAEQYPSRGYPVEPPSGPGFAERYPPRGFAAGSQAAPGFAEPSAPFAPSAAPGFSSAGYSEPRLAPPEEIRDAQDYQRQDVLSYPGEQPSAYRRQPPEPFQPPEPARSPRSPQVPRSSQASRLSPPRGPFEPASPPAGRSRPDFQPSQPRSDDRLPAPVDRAAATEDDPEDGPTQPQPQVRDLPPEPTWAARERPGDHGRQQ